MKLTLIADPLGDNVNIVLVSGEQVGAVDELLGVGALPADHHHPVVPHLQTSKSNPLKMPTSD